MGRRWRQCVVEACGRRAMSARMVCKDHEGTAIDVETSRGVVKLEREVRALMMAETYEERLKAAGRFRQRVQRGDFAALFSGKFREMIQQAGAQEGLTGEIGALRLAVVRLMLEEDDPTKMATAMSKVANATANMMRTQARLDDQQEQVDLEIEALWESFEVDKQRQEEKLAQRWKSVKEEQEKTRHVEERATAAKIQAIRAETELIELRRQMGLPQQKPSPSPSQFWEGSAGDGEVFDVVEGGFATTVGMMPEIERELREAKLRYLEEGGFGVRDSGGDEEQRD